MRSKNTFPKATFERAWALIQENAESLKVMTEKSEREIKAMKEEGEKFRKDLRDSVKAMQKEVGGISNSNGAIAESYF